MSNDNDIHQDLIEKLDELTSRLGDIEKDIRHKEWFFQGSAFYHICCLWR